MLYSGKKWGVKMKKLLQCLVIVAMVLNGLSTGCGVTACDDGYYEGIYGGVGWTLYDDGELYLNEWKYQSNLPKGYMKDGYVASGYKDMVQKAIIRAGVKNIGKNAFYGYSRLSSITIEEGLEEIGDYAFSGTAIREIILPASLRRIGKEAFAHCDQLERVVFQNGVEMIGSKAFYSDESLSEINFPESLYAVGEDVLGGTRVEVSDRNPDYYLKDGVMWKLKSGAENRISKVYQLPYNVSVIADNVLKNVEMSHVTLNEHLRGIGAHNFNGSVLYGEKTFTSIELPDTLKYIGEKAFANTELKRIVLPESVEHLGTRAFAYSSLSFVQLNSGLKHMGAYVFDGCEFLDYILTPQDMIPEYLDARAYRGCQYYDQLLYQDLDGMIYINDLFMQVRGKDQNGSVIPTPLELEIRYGTKAISYQPFYECQSKNITKLHIPETVMRIGALDCKNLKMLYYGGTIEMWEKMPFHEPFQSSAYIDYGRKLGFDSLQVTLSCYEYFIGHDSPYKPNVTVKRKNGKVLNLATDYNITYERYENLKKPGTHYVTITLKGAYGGEKQFAYLTKKVEPLDLKASLYQDHDDIKLTWSPVEGAVEYHIYMYKQGASAYKYQKKTTGTSFIKKNLADGVRYYFKVVPCYRNQDGYILEALRGKEKDIATLGKCKKPELKERSDGKLMVSYTTRLNIAGYQISRAFSPDEKRIVNTKAKNTYHVYKSTRNKKYYYRIRFYKIVDGVTIYSPWSDPVEYIRR